MSKTMQGFLVLLALMAILGFIMTAIWTAGERHVLKGLLADGYDVVIDRSVRVGEGRYTIRVWERGVGWVVVER